MSDFVRFSELKTRQKRAISALLTERDLKSAARAAGLSERTLYRWMTDPAFRSALTSAEAVNIDFAGRRLLSGQGAALEALEAIIGSGNDTNRRLAAIAWIDLALRYREIKNLEQRLSELETRVYGQSR